MSAAVKVPHVHAEAIHAFADGFEIESRESDSRKWEINDDPRFAEGWQYRVKVERVYPVTGMTGQECRNVFNAAPDDNNIDHWLAIANAALRHACDSNEILTLADHQAAIAEFGERLRDAASGRDMAIAEAVRANCCNCADDRGSHITSDVMGRIDLAAIIAKVPTC